MQTSTGEIIDAFANAMLQSGVNPPDSIEPDGKLHRFSTEGKSGSNKTGYYVLHLDGRPAGTFGDWRTGVQTTWSHKSDKPISKEELAAARKAVNVAKAKRAKEELERAKQAVTRAGKLWSAGDLGDNGYAERKGIQTHGARLCRNGTTIGGLDCNNALMVPMHDRLGDIHGLQFIAEDGTKRFLPGSAKRGKFFMLGTPKSWICIAEGFATAASIHEATGLATVVAFDAGNLVPVARAIRKAYPKMSITICADDDWQTEGNPGITEATKAVMVSRGSLAIPKGWNYGKRGTDFNDLVAVLGIDAGKMAIGQAVLHSTPWSAL